MRIRRAHRPHKPSRQAFQEAKQKKSSFQSKTERKRTARQDEKKAKQSFWDRHIGLGSSTGDFGRPKESLIDKVNESGLREMAIGGGTGALLGAGVGYALGMN